MGATNEYKGFHWVCKAWPRIKEKYPLAQLWVMGSVHLHNKHKQPGLTGVSEKSFETQYLFPYLGNNKEAWHAKGVHFLGNMGARQLQEKVRQCDLGIVNPNIAGSMETFCVSALDFQAMGVPVLGGDAGGLRETILHQQTGWLVKDPDRLADAVIMLLSKREALFQMGYKGRHWVHSQFDKEKILVEWHKLFQKIENEEPGKLLWPRAKEIDIKRMLKVGAGWFRKLIS
jgi:glycosyltransferase involved in cell wall biosynthesis